MQVPVAKTLLKFYTDGGNVINRTVDFIDFDGARLYDIDSIIIGELPNREFGLTDYESESVKYNGRENAIITLFNRGKKVGEINVEIVPVLEFAGKYFIGLKEII